jgi:o-succinylbenzoate synthase
VRFPGIAAWFRGDPTSGDPALRRVLDGAVPFALPMTRQFRGTVVREGVLIRGPAGWGEFAPFADYDAAGSVPWLVAALEAAFLGWPPAVRDTVGVNAIVPAVPATEAAALTREAVSRGIRTVKVKVAEPGTSVVDDDERVGAVRDSLDAALGAGAGRIRVDANTAWSVSDAEQALRLLARHGLEYAEQPVATLAEMAELRRRVDVPVAVDELLRRCPDPAAVRWHDVADVAVLKVGPLGGVRRSLEVAQTVGLPVVVSGAVDSSVGLAAGLALAGALPRMDRDCGLGTGALLAADVTAAAVLPEHGRLRVMRTDPDYDALMAARSRLGDDAARAWRHRLASAWEAGAADVVRPWVTP